MTHKMDITWHYDPAATGVKKWHKWSLITEEYQISDVDRRIAWAPGTEAILAAAFALRLDRFTGWDLTALAPPLAEAVRQAARWYKRGVPVRPTMRTESPSTSGSYPVHFYDPGASDWLKAMGAEYLVLDAQVESLWLPLPGLRHRHIMRASEHTKTLDTVATILSSWQQRGRPAPWLIVGGGIVSDLAAFAASIAGVPFTLVPTTLLAMADAAIGGKTGANVPPHGKNQVGSFAFPEAVHINPIWLTTLPPREIRAGFTECLKHAILGGDKALQQQLVMEAQGLAMTPPTLQRVVAFKQQIVNQDPHEHGIRAILNFGHTLGHALEAWSHAHGREDQVLHGEAVAIGMAYATFLSESTGLSPAGREEILQAIKDAAILPPRTALGAIFATTRERQVLAFQELAKHLGSDKKADGMARWVLFQGQGCLAEGNGSYTVPVGEAECLTAWEKLMDWYP